MSRPATAPVLRLKLPRQEAPKRCHVYHLVDPRNRVVRYVGKTQTPKARLTQHIADARDRQATRKQQWIAELLADGLRPVLVIASTHPTDAAARTAESADCHQHLATIYNIHDPAKGAGDLAKS